MKDKFGFVDSKNNWIIAPQYDDVKVQAEFSGEFDFDMKYFLDGIAIVKVGEKWGLISEKGDWVMEEKMKALALQEFGTLEGVTITYSVDSATGRINYCFTRR